MLTMWFPALISKANPETFVWACAVYSVAMVLWGVM